MSAEDNMNTLKQIPPVSNFERKRARRSAIALAASTIISILLFIYAFLQKKEADKQAIESAKYKVIAEKVKEEAVAAQMEAMRQRKMAEAAQALAETQRVLAEQALANCKGVKRK